MCDDFMDDWDDMDDVFFDQSNDFEEDFIEEYEGQKTDYKKSKALSVEELERLSWTNAMVVSSMIAGCVYDELSYCKKHKKGGK